MSVLPIVHESSVYFRYTPNDKAANHGAGVLGFPKTHWDTTGALGLASKASFGEFENMVWLGWHR